MRTPPAVRQECSSWFSSSLKFCSRKTGYATRSMIVSRHAFARDPLIFDRRLEHHAARELVHHAALDLLPGCLVLGHPVPASPLERRAPPFVLGLADQDVGGPIVQIDAHAVASLQDREPTTGRGFRRSIQDGRRA